MLYELSQQEKQLDEDMSSGREASTSRVSRKDSFEKFVIPKKLPPNEYVFEGPPARTGYSSSSMSPAPKSRRRVYSRRSSSGSSTSSRRSTRRKRRFRSKSRSVVCYDSDVYSHHCEDIQRAEIPVANPAPIPAAASSAPVEENEEESWVPGASSFFTSLIRKIITLNNYESDPIVTEVPMLKSDEGRSKPSIFRLPPNPYIAARSEQLRQQVISLTAAAPNFKQFPKPPPTLERVAEVGDPIEQITVKEATKIRVLREVPKPPEEWNDILSEYNDKQSLT